MVKYIMNYAFLMLVAADDELPEEIAGSEPGSEGGFTGFFGDLSSNLRILILAAIAVLFFFVLMELYKVLIQREWHPANAKFLTFGILAVLLYAVFTVLFIGLIKTIVLILIFVVIIIIIILLALRRRK